MPLVGKIYNHSNSSPLTTIKYEDFHGGIFHHIFTNLNLSKQRSFVQILRSLSITTSKLPYISQSQTQFSATFPYARNNNHFMNLYYFISTKNFYTQNSTKSGRDLTVLCRNGCGGEVGMVSFLLIGPFWNNDGPCGSKNTHKPGSENYEADRGDTLCPPSVKSIKMTQILQKMQKFSKVPRNASYQKRNLHIT